MTDLVLFKLGQTAQDPVAWAAFAGGAIGDAGRVANVAALSALADRIPADARLVAVLAGEQVAAREIPAPPKQSSKLQAAAAYLLEDELAEPIEEMHIALSSSAGAKVAYAISKARLEAWLAAFDEAGLSVSEMTVDFAAIGGGPSALVFAADRGRVIASRGVAGFAAEADLAEAIAPAIIDASGDAVIIAYGAHEAVGRWAQRPVERRPLAHEADLLVLFGAHIGTKAAPVNFLTGPYRRRRPSTLRLEQYRRPAALAAGLAAVAILTAAAAGVRDGRIAAAHEEAARAMHRAAFPTFSGADIRGHSRQILAEGVKAASFLEMTARLAASLEGNEGVDIDRIRYDAARGQFAFSIRSNSDAGIETFRAALEAQGLLAADSGGYRRSGEAWIGEMTARTK